MLQMFLSISPSSFHCQAKNRSVFLLHAAIIKYRSFKRFSHLKRKTSYIKGKTSNTECFKNKSDLNLHCLPSAGWWWWGQKKHTAFLCLCHENEPCSLYFSQNYSNKGMEVKISLHSVHGGKP